MHLEQSVLCKKGKRQRKESNVYFMPTIARYYLCFLYAWFLIITLIVKMFSSQILGKRSSKWITDPRTNI